MFLKLVCGSNNGDSPVFAVSFLTGSSVVLLRQIQNLCQNQQGADFIHGQHNEDER